ncbi:D-alanyl-D-alanine carboxypeptidase [Streptomyces sp. B93]|uniref:D-alanyl-D-alanine carboxypeptidase n=1 Tax=Streptomyces sp. B93 TaxID=2824875 RepID=UPI001B3792C0|nr:D-alanyl-D-alanine carboxypeptidase [Streptomyces sp. B93]MBQ1094239.1 D-alanyl-D-alanine carboxypeptidase [Streptomyces sp. B93]
MAGESPDSSKQRESSEEPTSGSASPVPGARSESRDPRLAVTREEPEGGRADTATKVLSVKDAAPADPADPGREDRLRAAVAAWVTSADAKAEPEDAEETAEAAEAAETPEAPGETPEEAPEDAPEAEQQTEDADAEAADAAEDGGDDGDEDASPAEDTAPEGEADEDEDEAGSESEPEPESESEPVPESDDRGAEADADPTPAPEDSEDSEAPATPDAPPVDQPTAVFKAVRPKKPEVDQPTTMLKLGGAAKAAEPEESEPKAPEPAEAERTSRFVALKPLDEPPVRRPPAPPAGTTAAVPQVGPERTTQQPLPPKPPLDLLAELTNTPPPPATPLRTFVRRVKIWTPLVLLLAIVFAIVQYMRPLPAPTLTLTADDSYSFEGSFEGLPWPKEGQGAMDVAGIGTMENFGEQKPVAIGSVAKAMTAYVILKEHPLKAGEEGPEIEVDALAEKEGGYDQTGGESTLNTVKAGDKLTEREAIAAIMIPSANNIARLVARWDAGSEEAFVKKMNDTAKELGMTNTTYTDPSGLEGTTVSTAVDQVKLGNELVRIPALVEITKLPEWTDPSGQKWRNWNTLVPYDGAIGIKTGTTTTAGGNLLFAATKEVDGENVTVVGAILGQHTAPIIDTVNAVSKTAMLAARERLTSAKILQKGDVVGYVDDGLGGRTPVVVTEDVHAVGWAGLEVELSFEPGDVPHTAKAGTKVGTLTVGDGSGGAVTVPVALQDELAEPGFTDRLTRVA